MKVFVIVFASIVAAGCGSTKNASSFKKDDSAHISRMRFYNHSIDSLRREITLTSGNIDLHLSLADALYDASEWSDSVSDALKSADLTQDSAAKSSKVTWSWGESRKEFEIYLKFDPQNAGARVDYATSIVKDNGDRDLAILEIDSALSYKPEYVTGLLSAGETIANGSNSPTYLTKAKGYFLRAKAAAEKFDPLMVKEIDAYIETIDKALQNVK